MQLAAEVVRKRRSDAKVKHKGEPARAVTGAGGAARRYKVCAGISSSQVDVTQLLSFDKQILKQPAEWVLSVLTLKTYRWLGGYVSRSGCSYQTGNRDIFLLFTSSTRCGRRAPG